MKNTYQNLPVDPKSMNSASHQDQIAFKKETHAQYLLLRYILAEAKHILKCIK